MILIYKKSGKLHKITKSNEDVEISGGFENNRVIYDVKAKSDISLVSATIYQEDRVKRGNLYFFNGYQSWTDSREISPHRIETNVYRIPKAILFSNHLQMYGDATFYKYRARRLHGYDVFYIKGPNECFVYNLNAKNAYLVFTLEKLSRKINVKSDVKNINLKIGEEVRVFDFKAFSSIKEGLENFDKDFPKLNKEKIFGYTSWYNYYQNINEKIIIRDLKALDSRFNLFQIDDGYQTKVGDWLSINKEKFPNGLAPIVETIHKKGFKAGIWLAPFVAQKDSMLVKEHPEYFKKVKGKFVNCGANWGGFYALDVFNKEAMNYVKKCLEHYMDMGFDFFKLDFLYACNLPAYEGYSRSQVAERSYQFIRDILKDKLILGCGATLSNAAKRFDYLRIGTDVSLSFNDTFIMRQLHRERPSTKYTIQNTIYRSFLNDHFFGNDPDVFLLRDENISLSDKQKESLLTINALFGSVLMCSDDIATYEEKNKALLEKALDIFYHSSDKSFKKISRRYVKVKYTLNGEEHKFKYNVLKGEITNG